MMNMVVILVFISLLPWHYCDTGDIPEICGDYEDCKPCSNSHCADYPTKYLQNVCTRRTEGCICKHGKTGAVCTEDCDDKSYGIACRKTCSCDISECHKEYGCTNTKDNSTNVKTVPPTPEVVTSRFPMPTVGGASTDVDIQVDVPSYSQIPTNTVIVIVVSSVIVTAAFLIIVVVKCEKSKKIKHTEISTNSGAELLSNGNVSDETGHVYNNIDTEFTVHTPYKRQLQENNQYSYIFVDLSNSNVTSQVHHNAVHHDNYTEIQEEDLQKTEVSVSPSYSSPKDTQERKAFDFPVLYSSVSDTQDGVYNELDFINRSNENNHRSTYTHITTDNKLYNELNFK